MLSKLARLKSIVWGNHRRLFIDLIVKRGDVSKNVIFLIDTGAPYTYLSNETLKSMNVITDNFNSSTSITISINTIKTSVSMSHSHINVLGSDFLALAEAILLVNYKDNLLTLSMKP